METFSESDIEVSCYGSPILLVESREEEEEEEGEKSCAEKNAATLKSKDEFLIEECSTFSITSWISTSEKKQKPQKKTTSASFKGNQEAKQHNERRKNKSELKKTIMPAPLQEINTTLCNDGERSFDGFQNPSRIKQVMVGENNKSQYVRSFFTSQETRKQIHSENKKKDSAEIHNKSCSINRKQAKSLISLLEADQTLSVQIQPLASIKEILSQNKLTGQTKVQYEKQQEHIILENCKESKIVDISSDYSDIAVKIPSKKQPTTEKQRYPAGSVGKKNRQLVSKGSLEDVHGEKYLDKKKRATLQKVRETSLPKPQNNVLYQEDSCEQHVAKKHLNISVTPQNNEGSLSHDPLLLPLCNNDMFRREWNQFNMDNSDPDKSADLEKNLHRPISNSSKHKLILPTNTPNVRRSKRIRIKPLEYWRGERVAYKMDTLGSLVIRGIISPEQREDRKRKVHVRKKYVPEIENVQPFFHPAVIFDKVSNQHILLECVHNGSSPASCISNEILSIYKYLSTPSFASGKIILNPLKEKGFQYSHTDTLVCCRKNRRKNVCWLCSP
ncbi:centromere protein C isoform X2 [Erythrolamprus reginae]|uniref:centromere protein C isoform X2 n=1 Tax=Erythrolamprus reginae TaxID=121349 RepID=UPI00396C3625